MRTRVERRLHVQYSAEKPLQGHKLDRHGAPPIKLLFNRSAPWRSVGTAGTADHLCVKTLMRALIAATLTSHAANELIPRNTARPAIVGMLDRR